VWEKKNEEGGMDRKRAGSLGFEVASSCLATAHMLTPALSPSLFQEVKAITAMVASTLIAGAEREEWDVCGSRLRLGSLLFYS